MTTTLRSTLRRLAPVLLLAAVALVLAACTGQPAGSGASPTPTQAPLQPANPGANPVDLLAWVFTPIFQAFFIALVLLDRATGNIAVAIVLLTILLRILLIPLYRRQLVGTRQMQLLAPEVKEIQRKYKNDRLAAQQAVQAFYRARGVNPASGCLPVLLQFILIIPMYSVISQGLQNYNPQQMLDVFGIRIVDLGCPATPVLDPATGLVVPCLDPVAFGVNWGVPEVWFTVAGFGISFLAILSSLFQLVQSRMTLPPADPRNDDPNIRVQRQMAYFLPFISLLYGAILPAGLFLYWIVGTVLSIVQQYLIIGWGGTFPLFGWHPGFAQRHEPRFPVSLPVVRPAIPGESTGAAERPTSVDRSSSAQSTIRPSRSKGGRRGRRR